MNNFMNWEMGSHFQNALNDIQYLLNPQYNSDTMEQRPITLLLVLLEHALAYLWEGAYMSRVLFSKKFKTNSCPFICPMMTWNTEELTFDNLPQVSGEMTPPEFLMCQDTAESQKVPELPQYYISLLRGEAITP